MKVVATLGPEYSQTWYAAEQYIQTTLEGKAIIRGYPHMRAVFEDFSQGEADFAVLPVYNTREGENKQFYRLFSTAKKCFWVDNVLCNSNVSLGVLDANLPLEKIGLLIGKHGVFTQCEEFIEQHLADVDQMNVRDIVQSLETVQKIHPHTGCAVIDTPEALKKHGLTVIQQELAPHNRTRYAVLGQELAPVSGYDATILVTEPLDDRVGLFVDILNEFSQRGINIVDMRAENDVKTQKLQIHLEVEGHVQSETMAGAIAQMEKQVVQQDGALKILGSFPRIDMRTKHIRSFGFIGTGAMSTWFSDRLESEGYTVMLTGRTSTLRPEEMIPRVDVVVICVPISVTVETVQKYAGLVQAGQALLLLAGESEQVLQAALSETNEGVEVMLVHNLWGPAAATMKDKNAIVVRTSRSGMFCTEFEAFLYKHGADIYHDSPEKHDLLMGMGQKLPTVISVALAMTLEQHKITSDDIASHCTLTSLYPILAMSRVHSQNPRTYAEIMSTSGDSRKIVYSFIENVHKVAELADAAAIDTLCTAMDSNVDFLTREFLDARMQQARAVDQVLGKMI